MSESPCSSPSPPGSPSLLDESRYYRKYRNRRMKPKPLLFNPAPLSTPILNKSPINIEEKYPTKAKADDEDTENLTPIPLHSNLRHIKKYKSESPKLSSTSSSSTSTGTSGGPDPVIWVETRPVKLIVNDPIPKIKKTEIKQRENSSLHEHTANPYNKSIKAEDGNNKSKMARITVQATRTAPKTKFDCTIDLLKNFDRVPCKPQDEVLYGKLPRTKEERAKLPGTVCDLCREYYEFLAKDMHPDELQRLKDKSCRHRSRFTNPARPQPVDLDSTPSWSTIMPGSEAVVWGVASPPLPRKRHDWLD